MRKSGFITDKDMKAVRDANKVFSKLSRRLRKLYAKIDQYKDQGDDKKYVKSLDDLRELYDFIVKNVKISDFLDAPFHYDIFS